MAEHRWSGWPGAYCLDCGCEDPREIALADGLCDDDGTVHIDPALMECPASRLDAPQHAQRAQELGDGAGDGVAAGRVALGTGE